MVYYLNVDKEKVIKAQILNDCLNLLGVRMPGVYVPSDSVENILSEIHTSISKKGTYKGHKCIEDKVSLWGKVLIKKSVREMYKEYRKAA